MRRSKPITGFDDPRAVARYAEGPPRQVPGFADMQRMALILLAEGAPADAHILVVGAGGGLELKAFAEARPQWRFTGVDPSAEMFGLARRTLGALADRVTLVEGITEDAPAGPFDGATCLLTLHFLDRDTRLATLRAIGARLRPGAPFIAVHHSVADDQAETWLGRAASFAVTPGADPASAKAAGATMRETLPLLSPQQEERLLEEAGFADIALFYAAFSFRGWVAYA